MDNKMGRRDFLGAIAVAGAVATAGRASLIGSAEAASEVSGDITAKSASELAGAIRSKKLSSKAIVEAHLEQIAKVNPELNAIVQLTADSARKEADEADAALARGEIKGSLHGVPITIKDTLETTGVICTGGTKGRANFVPKAAHGNGGRITTLAHGWTDGAGSRSTDCTDEVAEFRATSQEPLSQSERVCLRRAQS